MITEKEIREIAQRHYYQLINATNGDVGRLLIENIIREVLLKERQQDKIAATTGSN